MLLNYLNKDIPWQEQDLGGVRPGKSVCIVRYGGFGDIIQASSVFPYLKEQGWSITLNTSDKGYDIAKHDPNVDEFFIQSVNVVNPAELDDYWKELSTKFSRLIQFSESIEGSLLAFQGRKEYTWRKQRRHKVMNRDYFARMHSIAEVPLPPRPSFYPTKFEVKKAKQYLKDKKGFTIMWALSGTSGHKAYPFTDSVVARLLMEQDVHIILDRKSVV